MKKFTTLHSSAIPMPTEDIDTDQIIPARFLKAIDKKGFGDNLFYDWRYKSAGEPDPQFILNNPQYTGSILVAGKNFGCGSSREHAAWALVGYGFQAVISSFFADIFKNNALNNGLLPLQVEEDVLQLIFQEIEKDPKTTLIIDLENQNLTIESVGMEVPFQIDEYKKHCLMNGLDDIDFLMSQEKKIKQFEEERTYFI